MNSRPLSERSVLGGAVALKELLQEGDHVAGAGRR